MVVSFSKRGTTEEEAQAQAGRSWPQFQTPRDAQAEMSSRLLGTQVRGPQERTQSWDSAHCSGSIISFLQ